VGDSVAVGPAAQQEISVTSTPESNLPEVDDAAEPSAAARTASTPIEHRAHGHGGLGTLALAALGVVFGDIGTSPLYSLQTVFSADHNAVQPSREDVFGVISMVFWAITIVVSYGYVFLVMRADNDGEGGILSLAALLRRRLADRPRLVAITIVMAIVGAGLFYGDSMITPAISVMSAIEGLSVVDQGFGALRR